jgi:hypothetical protein
MRSCRLCEKEGYGRENGTRSVIAYANEWAQEGPETSDTVHSYQQLKGEYQEATLIGTEWNSQPALHMPEPLSIT